jgi:hypothetical protein
MFEKSAKSEMVTGRMVDSYKKPLLRALNWHVKLQLWVYRLANVPPFNCFSAFIVLVKLLVSTFVVF